ncbi:hypothetical protein LJ725_13970 [Reyranella aquatilis]|uniref:Uncharacterized protein n=1 Tax=Reyranella aquatilis TaxID=2035356 RepID=A0ABS8KVH7_9HYPH|nr:hypothetical protein [Reyranella aquatilis]MCC8430080.1 hypothetical protein [Reyranella aquatilis]
MPRSVRALIEQALTAADAALRHKLGPCGEKLPHVTMVLMRDGTVVMRGNCGTESLAEFSEALQKIEQAHGRQEQTELKKQRSR